MFKRFIAILLAFTMIFTTYSMPLSFAEGGTINLPSVVGISSFAWEGKNPIVGEKTFFIEVVYLSPEKWFFLIIGYCPRNI